MLATVGIAKGELPRRLCRGHIATRIDTAHQLFGRELPLELEAFFDAFLEGDRTLIMLNEQNNHARAFPNYIEIDNPDATLLPNGALMSWKHREREREYLRELHRARRNARPRWAAKE